MVVPGSESRIQRSTAAQRIPLKQWAVWSGSPVNRAEPGNAGIDLSSATAEVDECLGGFGVNPEAFLATSAPFGTNSGRLGTVGAVSALKGETLGTLRRWACFPDTLATRP